MNKNYFIFFICLYLTYYVFSIDIIGKIYFPEDLFKQSEIVLYVLRRCITTYNLELSEKLLNNAYEVKKLKELEEDLK